MAFNACSDLLKPVTEAIPGLGVFLAWYIAIQFTSRGIAEALLVLAKICGKVDCSWAKWLGKTSWELGRLFSAIGWAAPKRLVEARYEKKPPKGKEV